MGYMTSHRMWRIFSAWLLRRSKVCASCGFFQAVRIKSLLSLQRPLGPLYSHIVLMSKVWIHLCVGLVDGSHLRANKLGWHVLCVDLGIFRAELAWAQPTNVKPASAGLIAQKIVVFVFNNNKLTFSRLKMNYYTYFLGKPSKTISPSHFGPSRWAMSWKLRPRPVWTQAFELDGLCWGLTPGTFRSSIPQKKKKNFRSSKRKRKTPGTFSGTTTVPRAP